MARTYFIIKGIAPPGLAKQPPATRLLFWRIVVDLGLKRKDYELSRGLNAKGEPLGAIKPETRKHRRSEMTPSGKGDPSAPYLMPGRGLSRTRSLLAGKAHADYAEFFWRFDPYTGDQWGRVLAWHAARGKAYDVVGLSPAGIASVAREAQRRWRQLLLSANPSPHGASPNTRQRPAAAGSPQTPAGRTNLTFATFGIGGTKEQAQKAIDEGRSSGFLTDAELRKYLRQTAPVPYLANPGTVSASVRSGHSNVILQQIFGSTPPPGQPAIQKAAMPPKAPTKPKPPPKPPTPTPAGKPVSDALEVSRSLHVAAAENARAAIAAIDSVHDDGKLPRIPVVPYVGRVKGVHGEFWKTDGLTPDKIAISEESPQQRLTTAHEIGHFIEWQAIPKVVVDEKTSKPFELDQRNERIWNKDPLMAGFLKALRESETYKRNRLRARELEVAIFDITTGETKKYEVDRKFARYLNSDKECWARAYSQYIAIRSKDERMIAELRDQQAKVKYLSHHWRDEEFEPIARAIDDLFRKLGWIK